MFNVLSTVWAVLALLVILVLGIIARVTRLLKPQDIAPLNKLIFMFCIPCLAFKIMGLPHHTPPPTRANPAPRTRRAAR